MLVCLLAQCWAAHNTGSGLIETGLKTEWMGTSHGKKIYITTADGCITCINIFSGEILWRIPTGGPMFNYTSTGRSVYIPSIDGFLFTFVPKYGYKRLSLPIRDLVYMAPFRTETGEIFSSKSTTTMIYVDPDNGTISASYRPDEVMPNRDFFQSSLQNDTVIIRTDYILNVFDKSHEIVRIADFDIYSSEEDFDDSPHDIKIRSAFDGGLYISVNDSSVVTQIRIQGSPINIFGYNSKFVFELIDSGERLPKSKVYFTSSPFGPIAIPARPLKSPSKFEILMEGLPALDGAKGPENTKQINGYGLHDVRRPFVLFRPLNPRIKSPVTDLVDPVRFKPIIGFQKVQYKLFAIFLVGIYLFLRLIQLLLNYLIKDKTNSIPLKIDRNDPLHGYYGETRVSIIRIPYDSKCQQSFDRIQSFTKPLHTPKLYTRQLDKNEYLFAYQYLNEIDYSTIDSVVLCKTLLESIRSIHGEGIVHTNLSSDVIFADNDGSPLLAGIEWSCAEKTDEGVAQNIKEIGDIILDNFQEDEIDPLLNELLVDMTLPNPSDRPTADEALHKYAIFMTATEKINQFHIINSILSDQNVDPIKLFKFEEHRIQVMQCMNWSEKIPCQLVTDLQLRGDHVYWYDSLKDLVRMIRNKYQHRSEIKDPALVEMTQGDESFFNFFNSRFPNLFLYCYHFNIRYGNNQINLSQADDDY